MKENKKYITDFLQANTRLILTFLIIILVILLNACTLMHKSNNTLIDEGIDTIRKEGITNFVIQLKNYIVSDYQSHKHETSIDNIQSYSEYYNIEILSDTIPNPGNITMYYLPIKINLDSVCNLGCRNRGDNFDVNGSALISVFTPFMKPTDLLNTRYGKFNKPNKQSWVYAINRAGNFKVGYLKDFIGTDYKVSQSWDAKKIVDINIDGINSKLSWSNDKAIKLVHIDGTESYFPIGLGPSGSGNDIGGYSGGKILISTPTGKDLTFIYGTSNQLKNELIDYIINHDIGYVLFYDLDLKSYTQTLNSYNGVLTKEYLKSKDNLNSAQSGAGSFVYLKN